jgi:hypothetical protein
VIIEAPEENRICRDLPEREVIINFKISVNHLNTDKYTEVESWIRVIYTPTPERHRRLLFDYFH